VLHRHKRRILQLAEEARRHRIPRVSQSDAQELNADFSARVRLGRKGGDDPLMDRLLRPVLDDVDDALFRTGHAYRNRVYHADHHNAAVLPLIARSYAGAVGRAFVRLQPTQTAKTALSEDIAWRTDWADSMIGDLMGQPGMSPPRRRHRRTLEGRAWCRQSSGRCRIGVSTLGSLKSDLPSASLGGLPGACGCNASVMDVSQCDHGIG
jgi:hypothetical protein